MNNNENKPYKLSVSILDADLANLEDEIRKVEPYADFLQIDVMDGHFVQNISFGIPIVKTIKKITSTPLEAHLMIQQPEKHIKNFVDAGSDCVIIHYESETSTDILDILRNIKEYKARTGLAINPDTPVKKIINFLKNIDLLLLMSVFPGFGGQKFIKETYKKIKDIKKIIESHNYKVEVEVDGGVGLNNASKLLKSGVDILVVGSAIYKANNVNEAVKAFSSIKI